MTRFEPCKRESFEDSEDLTQLEEEYFAYKSKFAENLIFDPYKDGYGSYHRIIFLLLLHSFQV